MTQEYQEPKKKKRKKAVAGAAIRIVDQDVSGFSSGLGRKPPTSFSDGEDDDEDDEYKPIITNLEEAKAMAAHMEKVQVEKRLQMRYLLGRCIIPFSVPGQEFLC